MERQSLMVWFVGPQVPAAGGSPGPKGSRGSVHAGATEDAGAAGGSETAMRVIARARRTTKRRERAPANRGPNAVVDVIGVAMVRVVL